MLKKYLAWEISAAFLFVMSAIWILPKSAAFGVGIPFALVLFFLSWLIRSDKTDCSYLEYLGIQPQDFSQTGRMFLLSLLSLGAMIGIANLLCPAFDDRPDFWRKVFQQFRGYILSAFGQQLLLQGYFTNRLGEIFGRKIEAALLAGVLFAVAHLPNPVLVPATAVLGAAGAWFFLKSRNIYLATLFHALLGTAIKYILANPLLDRGMRVGPGFLD